MSFTSILILVLVVIFGIYILKLIWDFAGKAIKFGIFLIIVVVGIYLIKPEILNNVFGEEKVESVVNDVNNKIDKLDSLTTK